MEPHGCADIFAYCSSLGSAHTAAHTAAHGIAYGETYANTDPAPYHTAHASAHTNRATLLKDLGRPLEARAAYERALTLSPGFAEVYNHSSAGAAAAPPLPSPSEPQRGTACGPPGQHRRCREGRHAPSA